MNSPTSRLQQMPMDCRPLPSRGLSGAFSRLLASIMAGAISLAVTPLAVACPLQDSHLRILEDQQRLKVQYGLLEEKLFSLYQYEKDQNPTRADLLQRAYQQSQKTLTREQMKSAVQAIEAGKLRHAERSQQETLDHLHQLLALLESEDRGKRIKEEIDQYQRYLEETNRLLRIQRGLRGQAESGSPNAEKLKDDQQKNAERTQSLQQQIEKDDSTKPKDSSEKPSVPQTTPPKESETPSDDDPSREDQQSEDQQSENQQGESPQGEEQQGTDADASPNQQPPTDPPQSVQDRLKRAEQKMKQAAEKLDQSKQKESVDDMREAEKQLAEAKRELEEILRQLREEEIERELTSLESRFRKMLEQQLKIFEQTLALAESVLRDANFEIRAGKLALQEKGIGTEASRALLVLEDDGSSIATTATVRQLERDIQQVAERLSAVKVEKITQQLEQDIVETLGSLIEALADARKANEQKKDQQSQKSGDDAGSPPPGEQPLVSQLAELKLIRGMQQQILKRHHRYAQLLEHPDDPVGFSAQPDIQTGLDKLQERQKDLQQLTQEILAEGT